jgi:hypothetical protein
MSRDKSAEDTFRALKQTPFSQMRVLLVKGEGNTSSAAELLARHGWTLDEYMQKWNKWWNSEFK